MILSLFAAEVLLVVAIVVICFNHEWFYEKNSWWFWGTQLLLAAVGALIASVATIAAGYAGAWAWLPIEAVITLAAIAWAVLAHGCMPNLKELYARWNDPSSFMYDPLG